MSTISHLSMLPLQEEGGVSNTGTILIHHICVGEGDDFGSRNGANNADDSIVSLSSSSY